MLKKYNTFINEEISLKGNPGIPGEDPTKRGEKEYIRSAEERGAKIIGGRNMIDDERMHMQLAEQIGGLCMRSMDLMVSDICNMRDYFMNRVSRGQREQLRDRFQQIEDLAESVIRSEYEGVLHDVELDIKIVLPHQVKEFMEEGDPDTPPSFRRVTDPDIKKEIHKRKISNSITQGEAKNTKHILHSDEVKEGINRIFGQRKGTELFNIWDQTTKMADKLDWLVPIEVKADMMENNPVGFAGAVSVKWEPKEEDDDTEKEEEEEIQDTYDGPKSEPDSDGAPMESFTPIIRARGVDFPMLLHETVKGIHELISAHGIPEDENVAKTVMLNTDSFLDEAEDFRYGPIIAADMRDFINKNPNWNKHPNIRQHVYAHLYKMRAGDFLDLMKGILSETPEARRKVDQIIDQIIKELDEFEMGEQGIYTAPDKTNLFGSDEDEDVLEPDSGKEVETPGVEKEPNYSDMPQRELKRLSDEALDARDFDKLRKISQYIK